MLISRWKYAVERGSDTGRSRTNLSMDNTGRGHVRIGCRDATGFLGRRLGERPRRRIRRGTGARRYDGNEFRLGGRGPRDRRGRTSWALRNSTILMLVRGIGGRIARGGNGTRGLGLIMLGIMLLVCFVVILMEDRMRKIWARAAGAGRHLVWRCWLRT